MSQPGGNERDLACPSNQAMECQITALTPRNNNRLPPELLGQIFLFGEKPVYPAVRGPKYSDHETSCWEFPPFQVCSSWRQAAFGTARLFTKINLWYNIHSRPKSSEILSESLNKWLELSGDLNLEIALYDYIQKKYTHIPLQILLQHIHRWSSIKLGTCMPAESLNSLWPALSKADRLEHLSAMSMEGSGMQFRFREDLFQTEIYLPRLKSLCVYNIFKFPALRPEGDIYFEMDNVDASMLASVQKVAELGMGWMAGDITDLPQTYDIRRFCILEDALSSSSEQIFALSRNIEYLDMLVDVASIDDTIFHWQNTESVRKLFLRCSDSGLDEYDSNDDSDSDQEPDLEPLTGITELLQKFPSLTTLVIGWDKFIDDLPRRVMEGFLKALGEKSPDGTWAACPRLVELQTTNIPILEIGGIRDLIKDREKDGLKVNQRNCEIDWKDLLDPEIIFKF